MVVLKNTSLCAIVRDEMMNPAGGIEDFIKCTVPFVESAVVVDTGSKDGTREILEEAQAKYPNLKVFDYVFRGFADARNYSLKKGRKISKYALILDADERLFENDFEKLAEIEFDRKLVGYKLLIEDISPEKSCPATFHPHNPRLFFNSMFFYYTGRVWEVPIDFWINALSERSDVGKITSMSIKHFLPLGCAIAAKTDELYDRINIFKIPQPSHCPSFQNWKQLNSKRANYR
jgi:glycosyltransferase involved in cell wall biosynthesis